MLNKNSKIKVIKEKADFPNNKITSLRYELIKEELEAFYRTSEEASFEEARNEFDEDEYTDEELRLFRIKFISDVAN